MVYVHFANLAPAVGPASEEAQVTRLPNRVSSWFAPCLLLKRWVWRHTVLAATLFLFGFLLSGKLASQSKPIRRVLILNVAGINYPMIRLADEGIRTGFKDSPYQLEFNHEFLETIQFPEASEQQRIRDEIIRRYQNHRPDVIITVGSAPFQFILEEHRKAFPGVPVVFCAPSSAPDTNFKLDNDVTGVEGDLSAADTIEGALRLLPGTLHLVVVGGVAQFDRDQQEVIRDQLKPYEHRLDVAYLTDLTIPSLLERLKHLPNHTIVLLSSLGKDAKGTQLTGDEYGPMVADASNAPVFSMSDRLFNHGEVGGDLSSASQEGKLAAGLAIRLLNGERGIPPVKDSSTYMFDWRALQRWGLKEKNLPAGSVVLNRQPGLWEQYKQYILAGFFVLLAEMTAIIALLWERTRRRKIEAELRNSEEKFSKSFQQSPLAIVIVNMIDDRYLDVNGAFEEQTGWSRNEVIGRNVLDINFWVDLDQTSSLIKQIHGSGNLKDWEIPIRRRDGQVRMALASAESIKISDQPCFLCVFADITERKRAEEALSGVSRRLIEAQEAERTRIARELHDDIDQRMAMVAVSLKTLNRDLPASEIKTSHSLEEISAEVSGIEKDIQALSRRLHSSKLDYLGLAAASAAFCRELSEKQNVKIHFTADAIPEDLSKEISLCLFRVLQEALHNAVKHSGLIEFDASLTSISGEIQLVVHDSGAGFDLRSAPHGLGIGLTSMRERLNLVGGQLVIESHAQQGTTIIARVPQNKFAGGKKDDVILADDEDEEIKELQAADPRNQDA